MTNDTLFDEQFNPLQLCMGLCTIQHMSREREYYVVNVVPLRDAESMFMALQKRSRVEGYTVWMRSNPAQLHTVELVFMPGVPPITPTRWVLASLLFLATVLSTLACGALYRGIDIFANPWGILQGWQFAGALLLILGTHELGHYIVGRKYGAPVSLPYFIPLPPPLSFTGTLGAVIVQREPMQNRKILIDVGLAGPFAGLIVAIPLLFYGLSISTVGQMPTTGYMQEGNSAFYLLAKLTMFGQILPNNGVDVQLSDIAFAAWIGLLVTMFNLLPIGQLDGGHAAYAILGPSAIYLAYATIAFCFMLGIFVDNTWLVWGVIATLANPRHPAPYDDVTPVDWRRMFLALIAVIVLLFLLTPSPLQIVPGVEGTIG
jgi:membrane-associated protease RseP (regulator of RpoE activity)